MNRTFTSIPINYSSKLLTFTKFSNDKKCWHRAKLVLFIYFIMEDTNAASVFSLLKSEYATIISGMTAGLEDFGLHRCANKIRTLI